MTRDLLRRFAALLLLTVFVGGGMGLQEVDALLYPSGHESGPAGVSHLDPPGGCGAHTEHCVLVPSAAVRPLATFAPGRVPLDAAVVSPTLTDSAVQPESADADFLHSARPPPSAS